MGLVGHIGRIGTLAVALGVGAVITTTPAICSATPPDSGTSGTHSSPTASESSTNGTPASPSTSQGFGAGASDTASGDSPLKAVRRGISALTVKVRNTVDIRTSTAVGDRPLAANADGARARSGDIAGVIGAVTDLIDRLPSAKTVAGGQKPAVKGSSRAVSDELSAAAEESSVAAAPEATLARQLPPTSTAEIMVAEVQPTVTAAAPNPRGTLKMVPAAAAQPTPAGPVDGASDLGALASRLVTVALRPLLAPGPHAPAPPSPLMWALLAWTRRQIGANSTTLVDPAPPAAIQTTAAQPFALPDVAGPGSVLTVVSGIVAHELSIYDFEDPRGRTAFVLDYSWGLTGTALGAALQIVNTFVIPDSDYNDALSRDVGFFVYDGGIVFFPGFITTLGNVTTNGSGNVGVVEDHEAVHVWQSRVFGPFFQISYVAWLAGGAVVGTVVWLTDTNEDWYSLVETAAYYDNPWEVWAYTNDDNWPPAGANPKLVWKLA